MSKNPFEFDEAAYDYLVTMAGEETPEMAGLRAATAGLELAVMQISPDQGRFMGLLAKLIGAQHIVEVGTFTGYSALCMALALPPQGRLVACDVSKEWTRIGQPFWEAAGVAERIDLRLAPAAETLTALLAEGGAGGYDMAFIDADKAGYDQYYELCLELVRPNGLILVDNVLWSGAVADPNNEEPDTLAIRSLNEKIIGDERVEASMVAVGDGLFLVRKR